MTYMVMETHLSYSVVLDEAGRFLKVANMNHEVGQTVEQVVPIETPEKKVIPIRIISAIGAVAACFVLMLTMYWNSYMSPFASIYLTINPEVRMEISRKDTVVGLEGVNADGVSLIAGYDFRGKSITRVTDDLVDRAIDMGFLSDGGMVTVNIDSPDEAWFTSTGITLRQNLNEYLSERMTITVEVKQYSQSESSAPASSRDDASKPTAEPSAPATQPASSQSVTSGDSGYGDSSYGDPDNDSGSREQDAPSSSAPASQPARNNDSGYGDSAYSIPVPPEDNGNSGYSEPEPDDDSGDSGYSEPEPDDDSGDSGYQESDDDGGDSGYDVADDDSDSGYGDADDDD